MNSNVQRFLGGSPGAVLVKLVFLSLIVGAVMSLLGITPPDLIEHAMDLVRAFRDIGFEAFGTVGRWFAYGAMVVVPLWLLTRLFSGLR